jgi:Protein of unknown function (DUF1573)
MLASLVVALSFAFASVSGSKLGTSTPEVDIGDVFQGDTKRATFVVENQGDAPLGLMRVIPRCGCTVAKVRVTATGEEKAIPLIAGIEPFVTLGAGAQCEILVDFNSSGQPLRNIQKEISVECDDPKQPRLLLVLKVNVLRVAHHEPAALQLGKVMHGTEKKSFVEVWPGEGVKFEIAKILPIEHVTTEVKATDLPDGRKRYHIDVTVLASAPIGDFTKTLQIETTMPNAPAVKVPIFCLVQPTVVVATGNRFNSSALDFGVVKAGEGATATFELKNGRPATPYVPLDIKIDSTVADLLSTRIEEVEAGVLYRVHVTADKKLVQRFFKGTLEVKSEHPEAAKIVVPFQGLVKS